MTVKPSIPKGTRDFSPVEMSKRNYIFNTIRSVYRLYGFEQIETPAMENLSTLMGKYGEEGDKLLFRILNSGDCLHGISDEELLARDATRLSTSMCEKDCAMTSPYPLPATSCSTAMRLRSPSSVIRYSRCGVPTARRKAVTASSINVMPMSLAVTHC